MLSAQGAMDEAVAAPEAKSYRIRSQSGHLVGFVFRTRQLGTRSLRGQTRVKKQSDQGAPLPFDGIVPVKSVGVTP